MTVLFTDLVGSTELMTRLGDLSYDDLRGEHFARLRDAVAAHGGHEVKNTGDGLLATFGAAAVAVRAAVAIQQATDRHAASAGLALSVRVGVALGDVTFEDGDVFGTPVVEAARLVAAARPGQILATAVVRVVAGSRSGATFTDLGAVELKGLPEPLPACEVAWEALAAALPLPSLLVAAGRIFVGRKSELERLRQRWKEVGTGERRLVLVGGEPGVGKTRLATELAHRLHDEGALVLAGRCDEDLGVPYQPMVEALRHYLTHVSAPRLGRHAGELARLVPELARLVPGLPEPLRSDPETERYRLFDAVAAWLSDASMESAVLLVVDDLQWAAKPTLLLLRHVVRSSDPMKLLVVGTYRDTDVGRGHPLAELLADIPRLETAERLPLTGLDVPAVAAFLERAAGHELDEEGGELARVVWRETEGNPFFVAEVLRHLAESKAIEERDGRWVLTAALEDLGIPEGVRDVVGRRLSRLSEAANRVLACASVVGLEFEPALVQAAGGFSEDVVLGVLEEAVATRLLVEVPGAVPRNRFAHALVRATLYDELTAARRVALHRRVAEGIEARYVGHLDDHLPALAHHWARASAPAAETARAVDYATRAGDRALAQLAHDEAVTYYRSALDLLSATGTRGEDGHCLELLIALGDAQRRAGDPASRDTLLEASALAQARGDADALARAALANSRGMYWSAGGGVDTERVATLETALTAVGDAPTAVRARLLATLGLELVFTPDRARRIRFSDEALGIARSVGDAGTLAQVLMSRAWTINAPDTLAERLADATELLGLADGFGDPLVQFIAHFLRARLTLESGETEGGSQAVGRVRALADELGQPIPRFMARWVSVGHALRAGRLDEADQLAHQALEIGVASGQPDARLIFLLQRFAIRFEQGRLGELEPDLSDVHDRHPAIPGIAALLAAAKCQAGREDEARTLLERLAAASFELPKDPLWLGFLTVAAHVACHLDDHASARIFYDLLEPFPTQFGVLASTNIGCTAHYLGRLSATLGHLAQAEEHLRAAATMHERIDAPIWLARTRLEWAELLRHRGGPGDTDQAAELVGQALATAVDLRLETVERRARALLDAAP